MTLAINKVSDEYSVCPQISPEDMAEIARLGFKTIINNRPDFEGGAEQPTNAMIQAAAEKLGLQYVFIPVIPNNILPQEVEQFGTTFKLAQKPVLAFCRTGNRASKIFALAQEKS